MATKQTTTPENSDPNTFTWQVPLTFGKLWFAAVYRITRPRILISLTILIAVINVLLAINDYQTLGDWSPLAYVVSVVLSVIGAYAIATAGLSVRAFKTAKALKEQTQTYTATPQNPHN